MYCQPFSLFYEGSIYCHTARVMSCYVVMLWGIYNGSKFLCMLLFHSRYLWWNAIVLRIWKSRSRLLIFFSLYFKSGRYWIWVIIYMIFVCACNYHTVFLCLSSLLYYWTALCRLKNIFYLFTKRYGMCPHLCIPQLRRMCLLVLNGHAFLYLNTFPVCCGEIVWCLKFVWVYVQLFVLITWDFFIFSCFLLFLFLLTQYHRENVAFTLVWFC